MKKFFFWSGVGIVTITGSFMLIRWLLKKEAVKIAEYQNEEAKRISLIPRREAGFHAIAKDHALSPA